MSCAIAAIGLSRLTPATEASSPIVLVNGAPDPALSVISITLTGPLDDRQATLHCSDPDAAPYDAEVTVAVPHVLTDGEVRWQVLVSGRLAQDRHDRSAGTDTDRFELRDRLSDVLSGTIDQLGPWESDEPSVGDVLSRLSALTDAELVLACCEDLLAVKVDVSSARLIKAILGSTLIDQGLSIEQSLLLDGQQARRVLTVLPIRSGRRVALPWPNREGRGGAVRSVSVDRQARPPRRWVAQGDRPVVEDTFTLLPGWDPSLQGQPDSDYARVTSSDYSRFGSVYRAWVLNEDGAYSGTPFEPGPAFDAGALFGQPGAIRSPLRFGLCLTQDAAGRRLDPIVESSTDSGATWSAYPGQAQLMNDRAGVLLTDDDLPVGILSAAKASTLRLRVTASLISPNAIEATRWDGNPFAGPAPTRVIDFGERYQWAFVAPTSIHADAIDAGSLTADTADDRRDLRQKLQQHIQAQPGPEITAKLELAGAWTAFRPGDRVADALGRGVAIDGNASCFATRDAVIQQIDLTFGVSNNAPRTRLRLE